MSKTVIKVEGLSKQYRLGDIGTGTLAHDLNRWFYKILRKEDPYLQIGEENDRAAKTDSDYVWALRNINFEVERGDIVGIVGRNGAGKSTLLKILSRTTSPTTGEIKIRGRIASLLEVGTGFHPELSGRDNIFLNGAILGMKKDEIKRKFDEIVAFAGVERYIDTPVKRYSSGMYVRLAFGVAAHLEPEILIVDEVLAVGDIEFQKKALGKMKDVSKNEGRTVLFVSHNIPSLLQLCRTGILLDNGKIELIDTISRTIDKYINLGNKGALWRPLEIKNNGFREISILNEENVPTEIHRFDKKILIRYQLCLSDIIPNIHLSFNLYDNRKRAIFSSDHIVEYSKVDADKRYEVSVEIPNRFLLKGIYILNTALHVPNTRVIDICHDELSFEIEDSGTEFSKYSNEDYGVIYIDLKWQN